MTSSKLLTVVLLLLAPMPTARAFQDDDQPPRFRVRRDLVLVPTTVTDIHNRYVMGLDRENFRVFEDKVEQRIDYFANDKSPISVGFILDMSGSVRQEITTIRDAVVRFLEQGDPRDEYFLITFNTRTYLVQDFTPRGEEVANEVALAGPKGRTALFDALYLGLDKIRDGSNDKKALIVVSDGEENTSRYTFQEIKDRAAETEALIYTIQVPGDQGYGGSVMAQIVKLTGGRPFVPRNLRQIDYFADLIHTELRSQYILGFTSNRPPDGEVRNLRVRLDLREDLPKLRLRHRDAYRSSSAR